MSQEEIKANGDDHAGHKDSDRYWLKLLTALGFLTLGASQQNNINLGFNEQGDLDNSDWVNDFDDMDNKNIGNSNVCMAY